MKYVCTRPRIHYFVFRVKDDMKSSLKSVHVCSLSRLMVMAAEMQREIVPAYPHRNKLFLPPIKKTDTEKPNHTFLQASGVIVACHALPSFIDITN